MFRSNKVSKSLAVSFALVALFVLSSSFSTLRAQMGGGMGGGMGNGMGQGDMGHGMGGMMLISGERPYRTDGKLLQMQDVISVANQFLISQRLSGLTVDRVEEWEYNYFVVVKELSSQYKAFQLVIDKYSGLVMPGPGPNMMWNARYGRMMNGMADGMHGRPKKNKNPDMTVTVEVAAAAANQFLQQRFAPDKQLIVAGQPDIYYGYYGFDVMDSVTGMKYGMLSVNGTTGQVWYHTWHGRFVRAET